MGAAIGISLLVGWLIGFCSYWGVKVGYKEVIKMIEEEKSAKKEPLADSYQLD